MTRLTKAELCFMQAAIEAGIPEWYEESVTLTGDESAAMLEYYKEHKLRNRMVFLYKDFSYLELLQTVVDTVRKFRHIADYFR